MSNNFHHRNLQGTDFRGQNLSEADFSYADIRGVDFRYAVLVGANFYHAKAGLSPKWIGGLLILTLLLALFAGLIAGYAGAFIVDMMSIKEYGTPFFGIFGIFVWVLFLVTISWFGLGGELAIFAVICAACLMLWLAFLPNEITENIKNIVVGAMFTALTLEGAVVAVVMMAIAWEISQIMKLPHLLSSLLISMIGVGFGALLGVPGEHPQVAIACVAAGVIGLISLLVGVYAGQQAILGKVKYQLLRGIAIALVTGGGTKFNHADLTDANFSGSVLNCANFHDAILTRTCWEGAEKLDRARLKGTYLENPQIRELVVTKDGRELIFDYLNLSGLNLKDAHLQNASFIHCNFSYATLENADLSGAKLAISQLYQTNLSNTLLTGAFIENWGISTDTKLDNIRCEYIYMQLPTKEDPDPCRKPDNRHEYFQPGDFADFIAPIIKTIELYKTQNIDLRRVSNKMKTLDLFHNEGIDPTAAAIAITQLANNYPEAGLEVVALEGRGQEKIRLQAVVAGDVNRGKLYDEYFQRYGEIKALSYTGLQALLIGIQEKDERIQSLESLLQNAMHQPKFYVETYQNQGEFHMSQTNKGNVKISGNQGNISGVAAAGENQTMNGVILGTVSGNVTNSIHQLPDTLQNEEPGIKELLTQLQTAIESEENLNEEDKIAALEQLQIIAEAGQKPEDNGMQKLVKNAIKFIKGTIADLPTTLELVKSCSQVLPLISKFFGI